MDENIQNRSLYGPFDISYFHTIKPYWNTEFNKWGYDFLGRVKYPSNSNFIVKEISLDNMKPSFFYKSATEEPESPDGKICIRHGKVPVYI